VDERTLRAVSQLVRDTFCSFCGTRYRDASRYPRHCEGCKTPVWANPIPVCVALVPIVDGNRSGLLTVRRAIPPVGKLALVGGFLEEHESWQVGMAREVREETSVEIDPAGLVPLHYASSSPKPNRVLLFAVARPVDAASLPPFQPDEETAERGVIFGPSGIDDVFAFSLHADAVRRYFGERGVDGPHSYTPY
jgi:ADP-ribose pyrophosphatase YjhB (NUDIX family)